MEGIWETIISFVLNILSAIFPKFFNKREPSEFENQYKQFQFDAASALTMYACYYNNPVDLAKLPDNKLPPDYAAASTEFRKLGSTARALAVTMDEKKTTISKSDLENVSHYFIGLSNSMTTPYNCGTSTEDILAAREWEAEIKKLLSIN